MLNNQIIITHDGLAACAYRQDRGVIDAKTLPERAWQELRERSAKAGGATKARLIKCAKCWLEYSSEQWLSPKVNHLGTRVLSHQPGEGRPDHAYEAVEGPIHRAWKIHYVKVGEAAGLICEVESRAPDGRTISDTALTGTRTIDVQHQHSPFSSTHRFSAPERTRLAAVAGRTSMWHTTNRKVRGQVPILRTKNPPLAVIENLNYRHEFEGGIYRIEIYRCDVRSGHECPNRKFSGCGKPHARAQVTTAELDDVIRGAPIGKFMPMYDVQVIRAPRFFWTDAESWAQYLTYIGAVDPMLFLGDGPAKQARSKGGVRSGHSRLKETELESMRAQAVDLAALSHAPAPASRLVAPEIPRPVPGICDTGRPKCGEPARLYAAGWRCDEHRPTSHWFVRQAQQSPTSDGRA